MQSPERDPVKSTPPIDWREVCKTMLNRRLTSNVLAANEDLKFNLDDIYVSLALVERRQPDKRRGETRAEEGSQLYEPTGYEEKQRFEHKQFLKDILGKGEGKTKGRQVAIIGEPGAGKTTLLQKIAFWILEKRLELPIWISLADLKGEKLHKYLLTTWLEEAIPSSPLSEQVREEFLAQLEQGRVWLLLDGVDEMATERATAGLPLQQIATQLKGWIASARVVLTCRVNVWEANLNALEAFETYRMLNFNYPSNVQEFIHKFFVKDPANGEALRQELAKAEYQRLQDLVKNPLRLTLLCMTWQPSRALPETQAELYKKFVDQFYIWKSNSKNDRFHTTETQRNELNKAFGKLAQRGIDDAASPFRLRHKLVTEVLGDRDDDKSLFALALQLSWLNEVGVAAEETDQKVYAFYHATFQEYFAALSIKHWKSFLPKKHCDRPVTGKPYRIFDLLWKQTILLWLGRKDVLKKRKEEFIERLVKFEDGCGEWENREKCDRGFYEYRAYFLAAAGIAEFKECDSADEIVTQIVRWDLGYFNEEKQDQETFLTLIESDARTVLRETERTKAISVVVNLITNSPDECTRMKAASSLGRIDPGNLTAIATLVNFTVNFKSEDVQWQAALRLGEIGAGNQKAVIGLINLLTKAEDGFIQAQVLSALGNIAAGNPDATSALVNFIENSQHEEDIQRLAVYTLGKIGAGNPDAIWVLIKLINKAKSEYTRREAVVSLGKIGEDNVEAIRVLVNLMVESEVEDTQWEAIKSLAEIGTGNQEAILALINLLTNAKSNSTRSQAEYCLKKIGIDNHPLIAKLMDLMSTSSDVLTQVQSASILREVGTGNQQLIMALANLITNSDSNSLQRKAVYCLGGLGVGNPEAIAILVNCLTTNESDNNRLIAAYSLIEIDPNNSAIEPALVNLKLHSQSEYIQLQIVSLLRKNNSVNLNFIEADNGIRLVVAKPEEISTLVKSITKPEDNSTRSKAVESLTNILTAEEHMPFVVTALKDCLSAEIYKNDFQRFKESFRVIWHCAQNLPYPDFYKAWRGGEDEGKPENLAELPQRLHAKLEEMGLSSSLQLICIDGSKFIDKDNPAAKVYNEMRRANCPKSADGTPKTMVDLQSYWDELTLESEQPLSLVFYNSLTTPELSGFSERFLQDLSKFEGAICVVTEARVSGLQTFSPSQENWVADMVNWMKK